MRLRLVKQRRRAMTLFEVMVVVVALLLLAAVLLPSLGTMRHHNGTTNCINNLKQVALCFRIWEGDNNDLNLMAVSVTNGGARELMATGNVTACFLVMSNELSTTKILICPADLDHIRAVAFGSLNNSNISYFVGLDATNDATPTLLQTGDSDLTLGGKQAASGVFAFTSNAPVSWTTARHGYGGNLAFADGSVRTAPVTTMPSIIRDTRLATNYLAIP